MLEQCKNIVNFILGTLLGVLALLMFSQVISRYIFNYSITWSEEFPRLLLVWIVFFGLVTVPFKEHLTIDLLNINRAINAIADIIIVIVACICIYYGFLFQNKFLVQLEHSYLYSNSWFINFSKVLWVNFFWFAKMVKSLFS